MRWGSREWMVSSVAVYLNSGFGRLRRGVVPERRVPFFHHGFDLQIFGIPCRLICAENVLRRVKRPELELRCAAGSSPLN